MQKRGERVKKRGKKIPKAKSKVNQNRKYIIQPQLPDYPTQVQAQAQAQAQTPNNVENFAVSVKIDENYADSEIFIIVRCLATTR